MPIARIAEVTGLPQSVVQRDLTRAVGKIRARIFAIYGTTDRTTFLRIIAQIQTTHDQTT